MYASETTEGPSYSLNQLTLKHKIGFRCRKRRCYCVSPTTTDSEGLAVKSMEPDSGSKLSKFNIQFIDIYI